MRRLPKLIFYFLLASCIWLIFIGAHIWNYGIQDNAVKSDCVIVLGAAAYYNKPSPVFKARIDHAISLYRQRITPKIIFTGGFGTGAPYSESDVARLYALRQGVKASDIFMESESRSTVNNLVEANKIMTTHNLTTAIIVSDPLHLKRASMIAKKLTISAVTSPTPTSRYQSFQSQFKFFIREVYFYHYYLFTGS